MVNINKIFISALQCAYEFGVKKLFTIVCWTKNLNKSDIQKTVNTIIEIYYFFKFLQDIGLLPF